MDTWAYCVRRLAPFLLVYLVYEAVEVAALALLHGSEELCSLRSVVCLAEGTLASFCFCVLPYVLYLAALPRDFHGGRADRGVTQGLFLLFCIVNALEELSEVLSGDTFSLLSETLFLRPKEAWQSICSLPYVWPGLASVLAVVAGTYVLMRRRLVGTSSAPGPMARYVAAGVVTCAGFLLLQATGDMQASAPVAELYQDGLLTLFGGIFAFTNVPNLSVIFGPPCLAAGLLGLLVAVLWRANAPRVEKLRLLAIGPGAYDRALAAFLLLIMAVRLVSLQMYPLMDTTEARYGDMARMMVETGNWLQPQFDYGVPFWGKPPLSFWASAASMRLLGISEFAARLAPFLCTLCIGACFLLWPFPQRGRRQAAAACVFLLTCGIGFVASGAVMTDAYLALGVTLSMVAFYRAVAFPAGSRLAGYLFFLGLAIGLLSKGPLALVLCGLPLGSWTLRQRMFRLVWQRIPWFTGTALMLLLTVPWYLAAEHATPGFLEYFIIGEHFQRFLVKGWTGDLYGSGHARALGTIWLYAVEMFLPWTLLLPLLLHRRQPEPQDRLPGERSYLWFWGLAPLLFFTCARNVLPAYVLPGIPAFCLLLARELHHRAAERPAVRNLVFISLPAVLIALLFLVGLGFDHIRFRCDRDLLRPLPADATVYYAAGKPTYSARFYTAGRARSLSLSPNALPAPSYLVTPASASSPGPDWHPISRNYRHILWEKIFSSREE